MQVTTGQGLQLKKTVVDRDDQSGEEVLNGRFSVRTFLVLGIYVFSVEVLELGVSTFSLRDQKNPTQQCGEWINDTTQPDLPRPGKKRANPSINRCSVRKERANRFHPRFSLPGVSVNCEELDEEVPSFFFCLRKLTPEKASYITPKPNTGDTVTSRDLLGFLHVKV